MIACERAQELFGPGWDDELSVVERESLEQHFAGCTNCRRDYDELARTLELVQSLPRPSVSGDFATRVLAEARRREAEGGRGLIVARGWFARPWRVAIAAAFVVAAGVSGVVLAPKPVPQQVAQTPVVRTPVTVAPAVTVAPPVTQDTKEIASAGPGSPASSTAKPTLAGRNRTRPAEAAIAAIPDSLFDHTADVELVLDPVTLRKERGRGYTPVQTTVKGEQASITF